MKFFHIIRRRFAALAASQFRCRLARARGSSAGAILSLCFFLGLNTATAHTHVQIDYSSGRWSLYIYDFATGPHDPKAAPFAVGEAALTTSPNSPAFAGLLGGVGSPVWILPQTENPQLLFLGFGSERIGRGVFVGDEIHLRLASWDGPGHVGLYESGAFGAPRVLFNTRDGLSTQDAFKLRAGGGAHLHANWAFSAAGVYRLRLEAFGTLASSGQNTSSSPVEYTFVVLAPPHVLSFKKPSSSGALPIALAGPLAAHCQIEVSSDLRVWSPLPQSGSEIVDSIHAPARFYRARLRADFP